jgi:hypothetical protein
VLVTRDVRIRISNVRAMEDKPDVQTKPVQFTKVIPDVRTARVAEERL